MSKILECVSCGTCYESPRGFPDEGRKVRCAKCGEVWHAVARELDDQPPLIPDLDHDDDDIVFREDEADAMEESAEEAQPDEEEVSAEPEFEEDDEPVAEEEPEPEPEPEAPEPEIEEVAAEPDEPEPVHPDPFRAPPPERPSAMARLQQAADAVTLGWVALTAFIAAAAFFAYEGRVAVVRALPGTAWAYEKLGVRVNVRGLSFGPVTYHWAVEAGRPILEVEGEIRNITEGTLTVPTVVFALRNAVEVEVYQWAADIREEPLPGGERTLFLARIPSPPKSIESVQVRFARSR